MNPLIDDILKKHGSDAETFQPSEQSPGVWVGTVPGDQANQAWAALRDAFGQTGLWPVIRGETDPEVYEAVDAPATLRAAPAGTVVESLKSRLLDQQETLGEQLDVKTAVPGSFTALAAAADAAGIFSFSGKLQPPVWPATPPKPVALNFSSTADISSNQRFDSVCLALMPVKHPWEAPAYLGFGGWNDCPPPELHVAVLRDWHERFGAVPAAMTQDVLECAVPRPPVDETTAMQLAAEQWIYCDDIVSQGTQSVRSLAISLWHSPQWFFWWD